MPFKKHVQIERYIVRKDIQIKTIYRKKYLSKEISVERGKYKKINIQIGNVHKEDTLKRIR